MGVNEAGVDVVMELVDQLHGMRGAMRRLVVAINRQETEIQKRLLDALEELDDSAR
jgi:chaperone modulatory protein CbpM